ncbi:MAG: rod-binding protein [Treponema sp.]|jgi:flagellar protein FlgJ|nr:rod-binding protein [Treponema sp.]
MAIEQLGSLYYENPGLRAPVRTGSVRSEAGTEASKGRVFAEVLERAGAPGPASENTAGKEGVRKPKIDKTDALYEQCQALETFLIKNLLNSMRTTVQKTGFIDEGFAGKMYEDMLYDEYAKDFTKQANFGFAELAYLELTGQQRP